MAFNIQTFKARALTAIVFAAVMLIGLLWNRWSFIALFTIIHFGCWYEFIKLMKKICGEKYLPYCFFGLLYITMPIIMIIHLRLVDADGWFDVGVILPCVLIFSIWINDTMAYIVGSFIGKTPFSKISPKKTWEGTIGGAILAVTTITLVGHFAFALEAVPLMIVAAIVAVAGTAGDLLESKLKRMANVKDSGSLMPGHGGFLDRFDSLLAAIPFVWLYVNLFM